MFWKPRRKRRNSCIPEDSSPVRRGISSARRSLAGTTSEGFCPWPSLSPIGPIELGSLSCSRTEFLSRLFLGVVPGVFLTESKRSGSPLFRVTFFSPQGTGYIHGAAVLRSQFVASVSCRCPRKTMLLFAPRTRLPRLPIPSRFRRCHRSFRQRS